MDDLTLSLILGAYNTIMRAIRRSPGLFERACLSLLEQTHACSIGDLGEFLGNKKNPQSMFSVVLQRC